MRRSVGWLRRRTLVAASILSNKEIKQMRRACKLAADTLVMIGEHIRPGISTEEIK